MLVVGHTTKQMKHGCSWNIQICCPSVEMSSLGLHPRVDMSTSRQHIWMLHLQPCIICVILYFQFCGWRHFHITGHVWCTMRLTIEGSVGCKAELQCLSSACLHCQIASLWLTSLGRKPCRTQWSLAVEVNNALCMGARSSVFDCLITWRTSFAEYRKYFVARFSDVHVFSYNSARSEQIWMKFGELREYCLELALTDFGRESCRSESGRACGSFFLSGK